MEEQDSGTAGKGLPVQTISAQASAKPFDASRVLRLQRTRLILPQRGMFKTRCSLRIRTGLHLAPTAQLETCCAPSSSYRREMTPDEKFETERSPREAAITRTRDTAGN